MPSLRNPLGLRGKLILAIIVAGTLPIAIALAITYLKGESEMRDVIGASFEALANDNARKIAAELQRVLDADALLAARAAANPVVREWRRPAQPLRWPALPDDTAASPALLESAIVRFGPSDDAMTRVDALTHTEKRGHVFHTRSIIDGVGWLVRTYDVRVFLDPLVYPIRFGATGHVMLIDGAGTVLSCPFLATGSTVPNWPSLPGITDAVPGWKQVAADGHGGHDMSLIGHAPVADPAVAANGWYTFVWQDSNEIFAPVTDLRVGIATAGALAFALLAVLGFYASRRIVAPIKSLGADARRVAAGDLDHPIAIHTRDEIEELARQFDDMRMQLRKLIATLEERVEERTRALRETQAEKERIVEQLIQAEKIAAIGTMASGIGHEINNPLYTILSTAEAVRDAAPAAGIRDDAQAIIDRCKHIAAIVKNLSGYARPGDRQSQQRVDVNMRLREALAMANRSQLGGNLTIIEKLGQIPTIAGKPEEIQQAFFNIIRNGLEAMYGNGTLTLESCFEKPDVVVRISDTGTGIAKEHLGKIFDPFFTTKGPDEGEGLGLYVVQQAVARNGGVIAVDSIGGKGTTFTLRFFRQSWMNLMNPEENR